MEWSTADRGRLRTVAKGARQPKSPFAGKLDLFFHCEILIHENHKSDLHTLKELSLENPRLQIRANYAQTLAAAYFSQLFCAVAEVDIPSAELYDLLERALNFLAEKDLTLPAVLHFEKQLAMILGLDLRSNTPIRALEQVISRVPAQREELIARFP